MGFKAASALILQKEPVINCLPWPDHSAECMAGGKKGGERGIGRRRGGSRRLIGDACLIPRSMVFSRQWN